MNSNKKILSLFDRSIYINSMLALNAVLGLVLYFQPNFFNTYAYGFGLASLLAVVIHLRNNFVFQLRIILLVSIGYYASLIKLIDVNAFYAPIGFDSQTFEVTVRMFSLTSIALLGAFIGLKIIKLQNALKNFTHTVERQCTKIKPITYFYMIGVLFVGYLSARSYGDSVFVSGYASGSGEGQLLGNLQAVGVIFLVMSIISIPQNGFKYTAIKLGLTFYYLGWGIFIRGGRLEVISGLLTIFVVIYCVRGEIFRIKTKYFFVLILFAILMEAWGTLRSTLSDFDNISETVIEGYQRLIDVGIYHAGTVSGIAITFANVVHMIDSDTVNYYHGESYLEYILRTPPAFLYPSRPKDLAWMFEDYGYDAIGGFFELGEAYLNFGPIGCFFVPFLISGFIAMAYKHALRRNKFWFFVFIAILAVFFRGAWYQTFAFYKTFFTGAVIYLMAMSVQALLFNMRRDRTLLNANSARE